MLAQGLHIVRPSYLPTKLMHVSSALPLMTKKKEKFSNFPPSRVTSFFFGQSRVTFNMPSFVAQGGFHFSVFFVIFFFFPVWVIKVDLWLHMITIKLAPYCNQYAIQYLHFRLYLGVLEGIEEKRMEDLWLIFYLFDCLKSM